MLRKMVMAAMLLSVTMVVNAQDTPQEKGSHYLSLQANQLVSQIFNFGSPLPINNPYLIKYSYRFASRNSGISAGAGYNGISSENEKEGFESNFTNLDFRAGYEWYIPMGDRFLFSIGPDLIFNGNSNKSKSVSAFGSGSFRDSTVSESYSQTIAYGGGARLNFSVAITPKILIGTEASLYFTAYSFKSISEIERFSFDGTNQSVFYERDESNEKGSSTNIRLPVAIFLTFRF